MNTSLKAKKGYTVFSYIDRRDNVVEYYVQNFLLKAIPKEYHDRIIHINDKSFSENVSPRKITVYSSDKLLNLVFRDKHGGGNVLGIEKSDSVTTEKFKAELQKFVKENPVAETKKKPVKKTIKKPAKKDHTLFSYVDTTGKKSDYYVQNFLLNAIPKEYHDRILNVNDAKQRAGKITVEYDGTKIDNLVFRDANGLGKLLYAGSLFQVESEQFKYHLKEFIKENPIVVKPATKPKATKKAKTKEFTVTDENNKPYVIPSDIIEAIPKEYHDKIFDNDTLGADGRKGKITTSTDIDEKFYSIVFRDAKGSAISEKTFRSSKDPGFKFAMDAWIKANPLPVKAAPKKELVLKNSAGYAYSMPSKFLDLIPAKYHSRIFDHTTVSEEEKKYAITTSNGNNNNRGFFSVVFRNESGRTFADREFYYDSPAMDLFKSTLTDWIAAVEKHEATSKSAEKPEENIPEKHIKDNVLNIQFLNQVPTNYTGIAKIKGSATYWYENGKFHREDGPAIEWPDGTKQWWLNGKLHREDGPAVEWENGSKDWWLNGKRHCEDGPAVEWANGTKQWFLNGKLHREDGPACVYPDGSKEWWLNGKPHREDGPAFEFANGSKEWWLNGKEYAEENWKNQVDKLKPSSVPAVVNKAINLAKVDCKEVLKRVAAQKAVLFINNFLVEILTKDLAASQRKSTKVKLSSFLLTEEGKILTGLVLGTSLPFFVERLPQKYHEVLRELSTEFRIQAETVAITKATETLLPKIQELLTLGSKLDSSMVRVSVSDETLVQNTEDSEVEAHTPRTNALLN